MAQLHRERLCLTSIKLLHISTNYSKKLPTIAPNFTVITRQSASTSSMLGKLIVTTTT